MAPRESNTTRRARSGLTGNVLCSTCPVLSNTSTREHAASLCCAPAATLLVVSLPGSEVVCACLLGSAASMLGERGGGRVVSANYIAQAG